MKNIENKQDINVIAKEMLDENEATKERAINSFFNNVCPPFSRKKEDMILLNKNSESIISNPMQYARWIIAFAVDLIQIPKGQIVINVNSIDGKYTEINYESIGSESYADAYVTILCSEKGLVVELNGEIAKVVKNSENGKWNVDFASSLRDKLPLSRMNKTYSYKHN